MKTMYSVTYPGRALPTVVGHFVASLLAKCANKSAEFEALQPGESFEFNWRSLRGCRVTRGVTVQ